MEEKTADYKTHYYIQVNQPGGDEYYVGPFREAGDTFSHGRAAIDWIYRQVGLLKLSNPDATLVKHKWHYQEKADMFAPPTVEIDVEMAGFRMEIRRLSPPNFTNVVDEEINRRPCEGDF